MQDAIRETENKIDELRSFLLTGAGRLSDLKNLQARCMEGLDRISARASRLESESQVKSQERAEPGRAAGKGPQRTSTERRNGRKKSPQVSKSLNQERRNSPRASTRYAEDLSVAGQRTQPDAAPATRRSKRSKGGAATIPKACRSIFRRGSRAKNSCQAKTLADHIETDPAYEAAMEDYLNDPLQYILVENREDAVQGVERLKRIGAGKCTFMTLRNGHSRHTSGPTAPA